jgi:L-2-hydroxyglutarate oxidase LhgO
VLNLRPIGATNGIFVDRIDAVVIGAGIIGLAVARALSQENRSVVVVERHGQIGTETSSRNSGVIHSGIYYPAGTAKARLCVRGRELLYDYCRKRQIPHRQCGKLIVAQAPEVSKLQALAETALRNGVEDLQWLEYGALRAAEPVVRATAGLWCPSTGIVDVHEVMTALHGDFENAGGILALRTEVRHVQSGPDGFRLDVNCNGEPVVLNCTTVVNSAGLSAVALLARINGYPDSLVPVARFAKGSYFEYSGRSPFRHLIYPLPDHAGLGVHGTHDLAGRLRFGPDVEWLDDTDPFDYKVSSERVESFYSAVRRYWPELPDDSLQPSYSGIRAKLAGPGQPAADFRLEGSAAHGIPGLVNLLGMESPGLTASLAVAEDVSRILGELY